ncbi:MAG: 50S ribosomal protein L18e [Candidatus Pacearchaeota archaeon]
MLSKTQINKKAQRKNLELKETIFKLKKASKEKPELLVVARYLALPRKKQVEVNLEKIDKKSENGDTIIVPGKVLSKGNLNKKIELVAFKASKKALQKIQSSGSKFKTIEQFVEESKNKNFKIII